MKIWKLITAMGIATMAAILICFSHNLWILASALTIIYVTTGVMLLIRQEHKQSKRRTAIERNRERVFRQWLETDINAGR